MVTHHADRVIKPMIRKSIRDEWREVSWEEALGYAASELRRIQAKYGRDSIAAHHLLALHQRGDLPGAELVRAPSAPQRRYLRRRVHSRHRLRMRHTLERIRRHAGVRLRLQRT